MWDAIVALSFLYAMATYYHGPRALVLGIGSALVCSLCDLFATLACKRKPNIRDFSAVVTGLILPLMMPASIPYHIVVIAGVFAIFVAKAPFGGTGHNVFNPAVAGFSFVVFCFGDTLFTYPPPDMTLPLWGPIEFIVQASPARIMMLEGTPGHGVLDMLLGNYPGPMGATNILILIACLLYLVFRGTVRWSLPFSFFASVAAFAFLFPRGAATGIASVGFELAVGLVFFGGIFLLGDPVTTPRRESARVAFGICSGIVVMLFRYFGGVGEGREELMTYALLLMNAACWSFDMAAEWLAGRIRRARFESQNPWLAGHMRRKRFEAENAAGAGKKVP